MRELQEESNDNLRSTAIKAATTDWQFHCLEILRRPLYATNPGGSIYFRLTHNKHRATIFMPLAMHGQCAQSLSHQYPRVRRRSFSPSSRRTTAAICRYCKGGQHRNGRKWPRPEGLPPEKPIDCVARLGNRVTLAFTGRLALDFSGDNASRVY